MTRGIASRLLCGLLLMLPLAVRGDECPSLDSLEWLLGEWRTAGDTVVQTETWSRVSNDTFEGFGEVRSAQDGSLKSRETLRLVAMSGGVYFVAKVAHNELPVAFRLTECGDGRAVFENPDHDFPTRIAYHVADAELLAAVSGADGKGFEIRFRRHLDGMP